MRPVCRRRHNAMKSEGDCTADSESSRYYGSWLPILLELSDSAKALAFRFSSRTLVAARQKGNIK
jgi:hypothetical protein